MPDDDEGYHWSVHWCTGLPLVEAAWWYQPLARSNLAESCSCHPCLSWPTRHQASTSSSAFSRSSSSSGKLLALPPRRRVAGEVSSIKWQNILIRNLLVMVFSSSPAFLAVSQGFTIFGEIFIPTIEVFTFCLHVRCILCVYLLLTLTRLRRECQDLWVHAMECLCGQTRPWFILSPKTVYREWSQNPH